MATFVKRSNCSEYFGIFSATFRDFLSNLSANGGQLVDRARGGAP